MEEAKQELKDVVEFLRNPERFKRLGGKMPTGESKYGVKCIVFSVLLFLSISWCHYMLIFVVFSRGPSDWFARNREDSSC